MSNNLNIVSNLQNTSEQFKKLFLVEQIEQNEKIEEQQGLLNEINREYLEDKKTGIYNFFININKKYLLIYFFILLFIYSFINNIDFNIKNFIALCISLLIIYIINERNDNLYVDDMKDLELKLLSIYPQPKYFHHDSGIINIIYSIKELRNRSEKIFDELVEELDSFLETEELFYNESLKNKQDLYDILKGKRKKILNILHSFVHNIDSGDKMTKENLNVSLDSLHYILNIHIKNMASDINTIVERSETTTSSRIVDEEGYEEPYDPMDDSNYVFYV